MNEKKEKKVIKCLSQKIADITHVFKTPRVDQTRQISTNWVKNLHLTGPYEPWEGGGGEELRSVSTIYEPFSFFLLFK